MLMKLWAPVISIPAIQIYGYTVYRSFTVERYHYTSHNNELRDIRDKILYSSIQQIINKIEINSDV